MTNGLCSVVKIVFTTFCFETDNYLSILSTIATSDDNFFPRHKNYDETGEIQTEVIRKQSMLFSVSKQKAVFFVAEKVALTRSLYYVIKCLEAVRDKASFNTVNHLLKSDFMSIKRHTILTLT